MSQLNPLQGIVAYPITPFTDGGDAVDTTELAALVERLVASGVHAIAPLGSTGESAYLTEAEFDAVVDTTVAAVDGRIPVVVGASDLTTANTIRRARYSERAGAVRNGGQQGRRRDRTAAGHGCPHNAHALAAWTS